jgi:replicative DNA helicase
MKEPKKFIDQQESKRRFLEWLQQRQDKEPFFRSGLKAHDQAAGAFQRGGFYLFAARPGIGKTAALFSLAYRQARAGVATYFANLEMTVEQMWCRLAALHDKRFTVRGILEDQTQDTRQRLVELAEHDLPTFSPLFTEGSDFHEFVETARGNINPGSKSILFIDYLGLFSMRGLGPDQRYQLISEVARALKLLAKGLNIPIIAATQLNRKVEDRKDKALTLADLRDSGELEQHADAVFGLTRENAERLDVAILKNRNGPLGSYDLSFDAPRIAVEDWGD